MIGTQSSTLYMTPRRAPARIHAVPTPKSSLMRFVDALDAPVALVCREGRLMTMNGPARDFFIGRVGTQLRESIEAVARHVLGDRPRASEGLPNRAHVIETAHQRFVVTVVSAGNDLATQDVGAMVLLRREPIAASATIVTEHALSKRFGLTGQEARVAVMLAEHRSNRDIAERLGVSVHTARHHTERVLAKLHIHSRYDVRRVIS
ncbi:MAG TPA: helix-turn-helix transcriptional regulator [Gemmatimonadaceae bacterium]|nr:helix-turn-helix transcriptional regulator [Gemmatimonadaceae bacterium]